MSKHRAQRQNIKQAVYDTLTRQFNAGKGTSRHKDKETGADAGKIYSDDTYRTYRRECYHFCAWIKQNHPEDYKSLSACRQYVPQYLREQIKSFESGDRSAASIHTSASALSKLYQTDNRSWGVELPKRRRDGITRSRNDAVRDAHVSDAVRREYGDFLRCCGLRRREITALKGGSLRQDRQGHYYIHVSNGKGGKERDVIIFGNQEEVNAVVERVRQTADGVNVFNRPSSALDIHSYRAEYAGRLYRAVARPIENIPKEERYYCRGDKKGDVYDRKALEIVSKNLGHNRVSVVVDHYLWT